ncbi:hypothetical protein [Nocardioides sp. Iso805N]|uniref:hypothetical protein n=1 Tax=Nocardioides sp. Iso805N TaxID=1283287 RepID=UPI000361BA31|nr:hypothetical protein [Nocardioides sp. Iso805N]
MPDTKKQSAQHAPAYTSNENLTIKEAAFATGLHPDTIKDRRSAGHYANAWQEQKGRRAWHIPVKDLVAAGDLRPEEVAEVASTLEAARETKQVAELKARIIELEDALNTATALAEERRGMVKILESVLARTAVAA